MKQISSAAAPPAVGPYSQGILTDGFLFLSGQIPLDAQGNLVEGDITAQAEQVFSNIKALAAAAGTSLDRVVKATVFLTDLNDFAAMNQVYAAHFGDHKPARSTIQVAALPRGARIEIETIFKVS